VMLAEALANGTASADAYNFGPTDGAIAVRAVAERFMSGMGVSPERAITVEPSGEHETAVLEVDSTRARAALGWRPRLDTAAAVDTTAAWYRDFLAGERPERLVARDLDAYYAG
ncbi:MAG TPA: hypothetical protein VE269_06580, partial [Gaiellaceae bacterium]|nr:hypothetical protein [Gaiellaceae bacterium]